MHRIFRTMRPISFVCFMMLTNGCAEPTEILITVRTSLPCEKIQAFALSVAAPDAIDTTLALRRIEAKSAAFSCAPTSGGNVLGSLGIAPKPGAGRQIVIRASLAFDSTTLDTNLGHACVPGSHGCIFQEAKVVYVAGRMARLVMTLHPACAGVNCAQGQSCFTGSSCESTSISLACADSNCETSTDVVRAPRVPSSDSGVLDSGAPDSGAPDSGTPPLDAGFERTLGLSTVGSSQDDNDNGFLVASKVVSASVESVTSIRVYAREVDSDPLRRKYQLGIYSDVDGGPGNLMARAEGVLQPNAWNSLPLTSQFAADAGYCLVYNSNGSSPTVNSLSFDVTQDARSCYASWPYAPMPSRFPMTRTHLGVVYSLYVVLAP
jgi:hypothetical protein